MLGPLHDVTQASGLLSTAFTMIALDIMIKVQHTVTVHAVTGNATDAVQGAKSPDPVTNFVS